MKQLLFVLCLAGIVQASYAQNWLTAGNSGTNPPTNFIGTTDKKALVFKTYHSERMRITYTGKLGIGVANPLQKLDVNGNINIEGGFGLYMANDRVLFIDQGKKNIFLGNGTGTSNSTGVNNTANGYYSLHFNTTGYDNTANGYYSLQSNTIGRQNVANGSLSLYSNTTGVGNVANGFWSLYLNTAGSGNTANGQAALYWNTTGSGNSAYGNISLFSNTTGSYNTAYGNNSLYQNHTGSENTAIGFYADVLENDLTNATVIGSDALVDASNKVRIGNNNVTSIEGRVGWSTVSDGRYKKNIKEDVKGLSFINSLRPITYTVDINSLNEYYDKGRKHDSAYKKIKADMQPSADEASKIVYNGFIAQEVETAAKKLDYDFSGVDKPKTQDGVYGLRYGDFVVPLVKAMQEQQIMILDQNKTIDELKQQNRELKAQLLMIKKKLRIE